jgi:hypothetical protein
VTRIYAFNGDADGLCALQQLRLAAAGAGAKVEAETLVTGVKRDIALLERVKGAPGDECTVLDVSLANDLAKAHARSALAIVSQKTSGGYLVFLRVPGDSSVSAEAFCRRFPTEGGRRTAAGINHLPSEDLAGFKAAFEEQFRVG